ncbi:MAG: ATP-dependent DNA helicase UvrD2 [Nocardioidaceae bacterium]|nr:ATP-dependent DNA helicase UvrD2 [Nocardioidaceae bacterium]
MQTDDAERLLEQLDAEQRAVATTIEGPLRVLAGAGTGKTRAITHRIAYGVATRTVIPNEVLAVTFTTRAAGELRQRLASLGAGGVQARTFHSAALRQARYFWPQAFGGELPPIAASKLGLLSEAMTAIRLRANQAELRDLAAEIEWAKVSNVRPDDYASLATSAGRDVDGHDAAAVAKIYTAYEEVKRARGRIDMEDVLLCAAAVLSEDERAAAAVRRQYQWFVVDEFQDVSPIQSALLDLWLGGRDQICVVGDPAQTIYSFAGASPDHLLDFPTKFPGTTSVTLMRNYRSTPQVVDAANAVMAGKVGTSAVRLRAIRGAGRSLKFTGYPDEVAEAAAVATEISTLVAGGADPADIAVLFRVNAQSENFEEALAERSVPFVVRGADRFFERAEVKQAMTLLRGAVRGAPTDAGPLVGDVVAVLSEMGWSSTAPSGRGNVRDRWESLQALVSLAEELAATDPGAQLAEFTGELKRRAEAQHAPMAGGVTLATLHAAKGLEWPVVFVVGVHEGTMPLVYAATTASIDEERRLLYVGLTRARDLLHVSWAAARSPGGRGSRAPSRFLAGLVDQGRSQPVPSGAPRGRRAKTSKVATCRVCSRPLTDPRECKLGRCADCPSNYDEGLYEALRAWRRDRATEEKVPAYCVFTDATLTALAEIKPRDVAALVNVPGIGRVKLEKYGSELIELCSAEHVSITQMAP